MQLSGLCCKKAKIEANLSRFSANEIKSASFILAGRRDNLASRELEESFFSIRPG